ncbi:hypothetical protein [Luteolibacter sp. Populi]|uniref:hypothetical protein n=1 Tax=Luteolibacter sp. Populi TaxID=3230487 RepID=UPI0034654EFF
MKIRVPAILLLLAILAFVAWKLAGTREVEAAGPKPAASVEPHEADPFGSASAGEQEETDAKSHVRPEIDPEEASMLKTLAQTEVPLPTPVDYPEQTVRERITAINSSLKKAGIPAGALRIQINESYENKEVVLDWKVPAFSAESATPREILTHCCDAVHVRYYVRPDKPGVAIISPAG